MRIKPGMKSPPWQMIGFMFMAMGAAAATPLQHDKLIQQVRDAGHGEFTRAIARYDQKIKRTSDPEVHIDKCKFIQKVFYEDHTEYNPKEEEFQACLTSLYGEFPDHPQVLLYRLENTWGDSAITLGEALLVRSGAQKSHGLPNLIMPLELTRTEQAAVFEKLSFVFSYSEKPEKALEMGRLALAYNDTLPLVNHIARQLKELNQISEAKQYLLAGLPADSPAEELKTAADLLVELKDFEGAVKFYEWALKDTSLYFDSEKVAQAYEATGEFERAREFYLKDLDTYYNKQYGWFNIFNFDMKHSPADTAYASYRSYRDFGLSSDPLGLYRWQLFFKGPTLPFRMLDFLPMLLMALPLLACFVIPYLWILPLHYLGGWLRPKPRLPSFGYGLRHFWLVSTIFLLGDFTFSFLFSYQDVVSLFADAIPEPITNLPTLAAASLLFILFMAGCLGFYVKKIQWRKFLGFNFSKRSMAVHLFAAMFMLLMVRKLNLTLFPEVSTDFASELAQGTMILEIKAMLASYGFLVTALLVAVVVPLYEEIIFRGVMLDALQGALGLGGAMVLQSLVFAAVHGELRLIPFYTVFGLVAGWLRLRSGGLVWPFVMHALNNIFAVWGLHYLVQRMG